MNKYTYRDNAKSPAVVLVEVFADTLLTADTQFQQQHKVNPATKTTIGVSVEHNAQQHEKNNTAV